MTTRVRPHVTDPAAQAAAEAAVERFAAELQKGLDTSGAEAYDRRADDAGFSGMALYTLIERDGQWWPAAARSTPIAAVPA